MSDYPLLTCAKAERLGGDEVKEPPLGELLKCVGHASPAAQDIERGITMCIEILEPCLRRALVVRTVDDLRIDHAQVPVELCKQVDRGHGATREEATRHPAEIVSIGKLAVREHVREEEPPWL